MSLSFIETAIDRQRPELGDVVIVKHTFFDPDAERQLVTVCSECGEKFPTQFRRMGKPGTRRACEVRNIPQCPKCRGKYRKAKVEYPAYGRRARPADSTANDGCSCGRFYAHEEGYEFVAEDTGWSHTKAGCRRLTDEELRAKGPWCEEFIKTRNAHEAKAKEPKEPKAFAGFLPGDRVRYIGGCLMAAEVGAEATVRNPACEDGEYLSLAWVRDGRDYGQMDGGYIAEQFEKVESLLKRGDLVTCDLSSDPHPYSPDLCKNVKRAK